MKKIVCQSVAVGWRLSQGQRSKVKKSSAEEGPVATSKANHILYSQA